MNTGNWTKLYGNTIYSTVWQEPAAIRCVWITLLMLADAEGYVGASVPGLVKAANVTLDETLAAIERFSGPDEYSRTKDFDGRRIEEAPGGWRILNFITHRNGSEGQREKWARQKRLQRSKKKGPPLPNEAAGVAAYERGDEVAAANLAAERVSADPKPLRHEWTEAELVARKVREALGPPSVGGGIGGVS